MQVLGAKKTHRGAPVNDSKTPIFSGALGSIGSGFSGHLGSGHPFAPPGVSPACVLGHARSCAGCRQALVAVADRPTRDADLLALARMTLKLQSRISVKFSRPLPKECPGFHSWREAEPVAAPVPR